LVVAVLPILIDFDVALRVVRTAIPYLRCGSICSWHSIHCTLNLAVLWRVGESTDALLAAVLLGLCVGHDEVGGELLSR
jgi:hypothetical protein